MLEVLLSSLAFCLCLFLAVESIRKWRKAFGLAPIPPGPKSGFILGNLRDMPSEYEWIWFYGLIKDFGELWNYAVACVAHRWEGKIIYLRLHGKPTIILNSFEHARELMDKRGTNYSDRPRMVLIHEL